MSLFQPGPYQSKILRSVVRQARRWIDQSGVAIRQLKLTASWTAQILLYPVYVGVQTIRLVGAHLKQAIATDLPGLRSTPPASKSPAAEELPPLTADTPIKQALQTVRGFVLPLAIPSHAELQPIDATEEMPHFPRRYIRGIATWLNTRSLVLVTNDNQILNLLTQTQQEQLRHCITWNVAHYGRYQSLHPTAQALAPFASSSTNESPIFLPVRWLQRWVKSNPIQRLGSRIAAAIAPDKSKNTSILDHPQFRRMLPAADTSVQQVLKTVQTFGLSTEWLVALAHPQIAISNSETGLSKPVRQAVLTNGSANSVRHLAEQLNPRPVLARYIQGIATWLDTRSLVLVTNDNQILDLLTPEQQEQLRRRITWEVAMFGRYQRLQQATRQVLFRLRPPTQTSSVLPPVRGFWQLMAWVQAGPVAIAANLFQEAALLPAVALPNEMAFEINQPRKPEASPQPISALKQLPGFIEVRVPSGQNRLSSWLDSVTQGAIVIVSGKAARPAAATGATTLQLNTSGESVLALPALAARSILESRSPSSNTNLDKSTAQFPQHSPDYIETQATAIGYLQSPLEKVMRWLDRLLLWLEAELSKFWNWLKRLC